MTARVKDQAVLALPLNQRMAAAFASMLLGAFIIFGVGLAQIDAVHNAAHDSRHGLSVPCH